MKNLKKGLLVILVSVLVVQDAGSVLASSLAESGQGKDIFRVENVGKVKNRKVAAGMDKTATASNTKDEAKAAEPKKENTAEVKKATKADADPEIKLTDQEKNPKKEKPLVTEIFFSAAKEAAEDFDFVFDKEKIKGCVGDSIGCSSLLSVSDVKGELSCVSSDTSVVEITGHEFDSTRLHLRGKGEAKIEAVLTLETGEQKKAALIVEVVEHQLKFTTDENPIRIPLGKIMELPIDRTYLGYYASGTLPSLSYEIEDEQFIRVFHNESSYKLKGIKLGKTKLTITHRDLTESREFEVYTDIRLGDVKVERNFPGATELSWTMENTPYYRVERTREGEDFSTVFVGEDGTSETHFVDRDLVPGGQYRYRVSAMTAKEEGYRQIAADTKEVSVNVSTKEIKIKNPYANNIHINETYPLEIEYTGYDKESVPAVSWSSRDPEIAVVDKDGKVTGVKKGTAQIVARLEDGNEQVHVIYVNEIREVENLHIATNYNQYIKLAWEDKITPENYVIYRRENDENWKKLGESNKPEYIDKTAVSEHTYQYKITVVRQSYSNQNTYETLGTVIDVTVSKRSACLLSEMVQVRIGETYDLPLEITGFDTPPLLKCSSSNEHVATVNAENKKVRITGEGRAEITIEFPEGFTLLCTYFCVERPKNMCTETEWKVFTITNQNRMKEGHDPLSMFPQMQKATDIRKKELVRQYSHERPDGSSCFTVFQEVNLEDYGAGENIASGYGSPEAVMDGWMNSPGHYYNIMGDYEHFATGETNNRWVQMFISCIDEMDLMAMAPASGNRTFNKGTEIEDFGDIVVLNCKTHGNVFMPLISRMCTGYDADTPGEQTITVHYKDKTTTFKVTIKDSGSNNDNKGNGNGGGGGGGGGRGSSGKSRSTAGGPGAASGMGSVPVLMGAWIKDGIGWWFQPSDRTYPKNQWAQINGAFYRFFENGYMAEGWFADGGKWYYLIPGNGAMATGWIKPADTWYYLKSDGTMAVGWIQDAGKWYYLGADGAMLANTITPDYYVVGADGAWIP